MMPTFSKLVAAIGFAGIGFVGAGFVTPELSANVPVGWVAPGSAVLGAILGWQITGSKVGRGVVNSMGVGISTGLALCVASLFAFSFIQMIRRSIRLAYDGPSEALYAGAQLFLDFGLLMLRIDLAVFVVVASALTGAVAEALRERRLR